MVVVEAVGSFASMLVLFTLPVPIAPTVGVVDVDVKVEADEDGTEVLG